MGPGDSFTVTLWGRVSAQYSVTVDRNGGVALPEIGVLKVAGLQFAELEEYLEHEFSRKHKDFKMAVTMDALRSIRVYVVGQAEVPGSYTVSSLSTVINALFAAGGPSRDGSLRKIRLLRAGQEAKTIDLYNFLLSGDKSSDVRLQDGDTIFIPVIGPVVGVAGNVKRPAIYEMAGPTTLEEMLEMAGGVTYAGSLQRVQVERVQRHEKRIVVDFDMSARDRSQSQQAALDTMLQDGDLIKVFPVLPVEHNVVHLTGHVYRPGKYQLKPGMRLSDLLTSYEVLKPQADLSYGEIIRLVRPDYHRRVIPFEPGKVLAGDESENHTLVAFDTVRIFRWDEREKTIVSISGLVHRPGQYRLTEGMTVRDLVNAAGGLMDNAYLKKAEVTRKHISQSGMQVETINIDLGKALAGDAEHNLLLQRYDHLVVRPIPELQFGWTATVSGEAGSPGV